MVVSRIRFALSLHAAPYGPPLDDPAPVWRHASPRYPSCPGIIRHAGDSASSEFCGSMLSNAVRWMFWLSPAMAVLRCARLFNVIHACNTLPLGHSHVFARSSCHVKVLLLVHCD